MMQQLMFIKSFTILAVYCGQQNFIMREKMLLFFKTCVRTMAKNKLKLPVQI